MQNDFSSRRVSDLLNAEQKAAVLRQFQSLTAGGLSLRLAAKRLNAPLAWFSGVDCLLDRFERDDLAGLLPKERETYALQFEVPEWFIPAARYFFMLSEYRRDSGSVPEAVRRVISLPNVPFGWTELQKKRLAKALKLKTLPVCPLDLREKILARQNQGQDLVPARIAKAIAVSSVIVQKFRSPRAFALDTLSASGSQRRYFNAETGQREIMQPGDWFGGDDATPGIAVCVPSDQILTPCSQKFGVLIGRWQWLVYHDARTDKILSHSYVVRPRSSYRAEDILSGMAAVTRAHGIPRKGWQFEGGIWDCKLVCQAIDLLKCAHWRTYSPHQKAIELVFNRVWTRLAVQFPNANLGRYRNAIESNCRLYEACKRGHQNPRRFFPMLADVVGAFDEEVKAHNQKKIFSAQYGQWIPDEFFSDAVKSSPLRKFSDCMRWIFSSFAVERKVKGDSVNCRVPLFENFSVPFCFSAPSLALHRGKLVRLHFDPRDPKCRAKVVLLEDSGQKKAGDVLADAELVGETAQHIRMIMDWAKDDQRAGYIGRQRTNNFLNRTTRAIGDFGRVEYSAQERRDGLGTVVKVETGSPSEPETPVPRPETVLNELCRTGKGKVARLPFAIRDQVNLRMRDAERAPVILTWLNELPEVKAIIARDFGGKPINAVNLTEWRKRGYAAWLAENDKKAERALRIKRLEEFERTHQHGFPDCWPERKSDDEEIEKLKAENERFKLEHREYFR
jgi:hypothetical protein